MEGLSEYEKLRLENILKNESFLRQMGISTHRLTSTSYCSSSSSLKNSPIRENKRKFVPDDHEEIIATRRSTRLRGERCGNSNIEGLGIKTEDGDRRLQQLFEHEVVEIQADDEGIERKHIDDVIVRDSFSAEHNEAISSAAILHAIYRIRTMNNKALANRMKSINRLVNLKIFRMSLSTDSHTSIRSVFPGEIVKSLTKSCWCSTMLLRLLVLLILPLLQKLF